MIALTKKPESVLIPGFGTLVLDCEDECFNQLVLNSVHPYTHQPRRFGITNLTSPPQAVQLKRTRWQDMTMFASQRLPMLLGTITHKAFEKLDLPGILTEQKYEIVREVNGAPATVVTIIDREQWHTPDCVSVTDLKTGSCYAAMGEPKADYIAQVNICAHALREKHGTGLEIRGLHLSYWCKDWVAGSFRKQPPSANVVQEVPVWGPAQCEDYLMNRLVLHIKAEDGMRVGCKDKEDRWKDDKWAVMKKGRKTAVKLFDDAESAGEWLREQNDQRLLSIEHRAGQPRRCMFYCDAAGVCPQFEGDR